MNAQPLAVQSSASALSGFQVPVADHEDFAGLRCEYRTEVTHSLLCLERVEGLRRQGIPLRQACAQVVAAMPAQRGFSASSLLRKYYGYQGGGWRSLVPAYVAPGKLPAEFVQFVRKQSELNHRSVADALERIRRDVWAAGLPVPGYGTWVQWYAGQYPDRQIPRTFPGEFPAGWSERNLYRYASSKAARTLFQRGIGAAKSMFPSVPRDTSGLRPMELITIDDFYLDSLCVWPGDQTFRPQIAQVAGLLALDVGTRRKLHWGIGPVLEREEKQADGSVRKVRAGIRRIDVQTLLFGLFQRFGLPEYPVTILCERATAAISPDMELSLTALFGGRVRVERTNIISQKVLSNGFVEGGGCPWEKGWIEAAFASLWNRLGSQHGYKGSNERLNKPVGHDHALAYTRLLLGAGGGKKLDHLPPEVIAELRLPFPSPEQVEAAFAWAVASVDSRTDHRYQGFDRRQEFLLPSGEAVPFAQLALLPPEEQTQVQIRERWESSLERWERRAVGVAWQPIPDQVLAVLLLQPKRVSYSRNAVTFRHAQVGYTYVDPEGKILRDLPEGAELLAYIDPERPEILHVATPEGAALGTLTRLGGRTGAIDVRDKAGLAEEAGKVAAIRNRTISELRERHAEADAQLAADRAHNEAVVAAHKARHASLPAAERLASLIGAGRDAETSQKAQEGALRRARLDLSDLSEPAPAAVPSGEAEDASALL